MLILLLGAPLVAVVRSRCRESVAAATRAGFARHGSEVAKLYDFVRQNPPNLAYDKAHVTLVFHQDLSQEWTYELTPSPRDQPFAMTTFTCSGPTPCSRDEVAFDATILDQSGEPAGDLVVLDAHQAPTLKQFVLLPLPPIVAGDLRTMRVGWRWPNAAPNLRKPGAPDVSDIQVGPDTTTTIPKLEITARFTEPGAEYEVVPLFALSAGTKGQRFGSSKPFDISVPNATSGRTHQLKITRAGRGGSANPSSP